MSNELTFDQLRNANIERARVGYDCSHWTLSDWFMAMTGEVGEAANIAKKILRGDFTVDEGRDKLASELADIQAYLDLLAHNAGIDLGKATAAKWDEVAKRIGVDLRIGDFATPA